MFRDWEVLKNITGESEPAITEMHAVLGPQTALSSMFALQPKIAPLIAQAIVRATAQDAAVVAEEVEEAAEEAVAVGAA